MPNGNKLTRTGVFYDGNFFSHVSNYYQSYHPRKSRISISGLHAFIKQKVAENEVVDARLCQIVDVHYFRGRISAQDAKTRDLLLKERSFEDVLLREGVTTHYLPMGPEGEKGIDVWLALEAFELAVYKQFDVTVLIAGDGDFVPLVRKLNTIGTRVMLLGWDFKALGKDGKVIQTKTSQALLEEVTYPVSMHLIIEDRSLHKDPLISGLFIPHKKISSRASLGAEIKTNSSEPSFVIHEDADEEAPAMPPKDAALEILPDRQTYDSEKEAMIAEPLQFVEEETGHTVVLRLTGKIVNLKEGFGFVAEEGGGELFFHKSSLQNRDFNSLAIGDAVSFEVGTNERGPCALKVYVKAPSNTDLF